jgi:CubicO group peptidase (beta-lactamase class C family)
MSTVLFQPLGMTRTFFRPGDVTSAGNYSDGLSFNPDDGSPWDVAPDAYDCAAYRPYGFAFSSASDLAKFVQMLLGASPGVLSSASRLAMQSAQVGTHDFGQITAEGYGLTVQTGYVSPTNVYYPTKTVSSVSAAYAIPGFTSEVYFFPETGFGFIALANTDAAVFTSSLDVAVQSFAGLPSPTPLPASTNAVPGDFASYTGTYQDGTGLLGTIVVSEQGGALAIDFPDAATLGFAFYPELSPVFNGSFLFVLDGGFTPLSFIPDAAGRYDHVVIADLFPATRVKPDGGL